MTGIAGHHIQAQTVIASGNAMAWAGKIWYAVRTGDAYQTYADSLAKFSPQQLGKQLYDDAHKKAFWLNIYNAYVQILLEKDTTLYHHRHRFFKTPSILIANHWLSLDDIEHGMLRHSKIKWSLGYFNKPFPSAFEKKFRVDALDDRIHFALNCGAKSCPPIAFYDASHIDEQLDLAMRNYLFNTVSYDSVKNVLYLPAIMGWFRHDFGGKKQMVALVKKLGFISQDVHPRVKFKPYDWTLFLHHFQHTTP
ncbi:MAG: DUF547 domain-containing protein [Thermoflavifilum sp.]|nr:DUF547 domain-containing protein [Thermoflavifilum sp.]